MRRNFEFNNLNNIEETDYIVGPYNSLDGRTYGTEEEADAATERHLRANMDDDSQRVAEARAMYLVEQLLSEGNVEPYNGRNKVRIEMLVGHLAGKSLREILAKRGEKLENQAFYHYLTSGYQL